MAGDSTAGDGPAGTRVHAFTDDALGDHDAVELARLVRAGEVSAAELADAARARAERVGVLNAVAYWPDEPRYPSHDTDDAAFAGVPTFVKDNTIVAGMPTNHGTAAFPDKTGTHDGAFTKQFLSTGFTVLGKTRLPEFGFLPTTEYADAQPVRNPWHVDYSSGGSSGGAAALVAAGVVPIAHGNDGGGSIRIPSANCGLIGLKPTRGRLILNET
ncbi:MAG: amidase, partial [Sciscionella sp.]|nr:amidase [Sciscionella sp.]